jgi:SEC-C motif-containing protein
MLWPVKVSPNVTCPCGSGSKLKKCCGLFHAGRPAAPGALMRARYSAFAVGDLRFLMASTHPAGPHFRPDPATWKVQLREYCDSVEFLGLLVHQTEVDETHSVAHVTFTANLRRDGDSCGFTERSEFRRDDRRWKYFQGELLEDGWLGAS